MNLQTLLHLALISVVFVVCEAFPEGDKETNEVPHGRVSYSGSQLWRVCVDNEEKLNIINELEKDEHVSNWARNGTFYDVFVKQKCVEQISQKLRENGIKYEVVSDNVQKWIDEENPPINEDIDELQDRRGHRLTWQMYHRLADINTFLDYLATSYPSLCSLKTIGSSVEGRPLRVLKISNGNPGNKAVWIDGGIHAREWISPATVTYIINELVENWEKEPKAVHNIDWHILPVANPDGYEYAHTYDRLWRKNRSKKGNCAGTDLNRNFGHYWGGKGSSRYPCHEIYAGSGPFSEPETKAIQNYITVTEARALWKGYLSFHSYGQYILFPWGYAEMYTNDHQDLKNVGDKMAAAIRTASGAQYRVGTAATMLYPAAGGSDDWAKGVVGMKYTYTIELRDSGSYGFLLPAAYINPSGNEGLAAVKVLANAVNAL
ncbi:hypothetical protein FQR65_LT01405 [Abscondita terminalis]|nr:hypothetical protein FQR65_LT01405 [Abscondita terminalis]